MRSSLRHFGTRLIHLAVVLLLVSVATFLLLELTPGDPAIEILGQGATPEAVERIHQQLGLDRPVVNRYGDWVS